MKRATDPRHLNRVKLVQNNFTYAFGLKTNSHNSYFLKMVNLFPKIDSLIEKVAPQFPIDKIAKIDVAILRLAIYEMLFENKEPLRVIIDEAVELAKEFGGEGSPAFINGVLGALYKTKNLKI